MTGGRTGGEARVELKAGGEAPAGDVAAVMGLLDGMRQEQDFLATLYLIARGGRVQGARAYELENLGFTKNLKMMPLMRLIIKSAVVKKKNHYRVTSPVKGGKR